LSILLNSIVYILLVSFPLRFWQPCAVWSLRKTLGFSYSV